MGLTWVVKRDFMYLSFLCAFMTLLNFEVFLLLFIEGSENFRFNH